MGVVGAEILYGVENMISLTVEITPLALILLL